MKTNLWLVCDLTPSGQNLLRPPSRRLCFSRIHHENRTNVLFPTCTRLADRKQPWTFILGGGVTEETAAIPSSVESPLCCLSSLHPSIPPLGLKIKASGIKGRGVHV